MREPFASGVEPNDSGRRQDLLASPPNLDLLLLLRISPRAYVYVQCVYDGGKGVVQEHSACVGQIRRKSIRHFWMKIHFMKSDSVFRLGCQQAVAETTENELYT